MPPELLAPVMVISPAGDTSRALGQCAMMLRAGLTWANHQRKYIKGLLEGP